MSTAWRGERHDPGRAVTLREFLKWGAQYQGFPYSQIAYWVDAAERQDGKDMYGATLKPVKP